MIILKFKNVKFFCRIAKKIFRVPTSITSLKKIYKIVIFEMALEITRLRGSLAI